jgi:DNA-binding response OmpR family regulator
MRILLVEDDPFTGLTLRDSLSAQQYGVDVATDGETGLQLLQESNYDLVLLDIMLPKLDGISVCQRLRAQGYDSPILLLTAKDSRHDRILGLDAGADDYVVKPFDLPELMARIRALLRRGKGTPTAVITWENICFDPTHSEVTCHGRPLHLTPKEYRLLELFLRNPKRIFSRSTILDRLWDIADAPGEETVSSHIYSLRQKLKGAGAADLIETVHGLGYRLKSPSLPTDMGDSPQKLLPENQRDLKHRQRTLAHLTKTWEKFKPKLLSQIDTLEAIVNAWIAGHIVSEQQQQAEGIAHRLAGSLGLFGWVEGSQLARQIELLFQQEEILEAEQVQSVIHHIQSLRQGVNAEAVVAQRSVAAMPKTSRLIDLPLLLIVDDDLLLAEQIQTEADSWGVRVEVATNLAVARVMIAESLPDAILLDLNFPGATEDGLTLLQDLANRFPQIPVLVFTVRESLSDRVEVVRLGGCAFLHKPLPTNQILRAVTEVLHRPHHSIANRVMVVGSDAEFSANLRALLQPWQVEVIALDNPQQFWDVLTTLAPELLIIRLDLSIFSGLDLCQVVRHDPQWKNLPILVITHQPDVILMQRVFAAGATDLILEPFADRDFVRRVISRLEGITVPVSCL